MYLSSFIKILPITQQKNQYINATVKYISIWYIPNEFADNIFAWPIISATPMMNNNEVSKNKSIQVLQMLGKMIGNIWGMIILITVCIEVIPILIPASNWVLGIASNAGLIISEIREPW